MSGSEAGRSYLEADVRTASPVRLVLMLHDFGIGRLKQAVAALEREQPSREEFLEHTGKAREALLELMGALVPERAPALASKLLGLYGYFCRRITDARMNADGAPIREVMALWERIRDAWADISSRELPAQPQDAASLVSMVG